MNCYNRELNISKICKPKRNRYTEKTDWLLQPIKNAMPYSANLFFQCIILIYRSIELYLFEMKHRQAEYFPLQGFLRKSFRSV